MKFLIFGIVIIGLISCNSSPSEFCGEIVKYEDFSNLNGVSDKRGMNLVLQLSIKMGMVFEDNYEEFKSTKLFADYSVKDTMVINILEIPSEDFAKKISCIMSENETIIKTKVFYSKLHWGKDSIYIKF